MKRIWDMSVYFVPGDIVKLLYSMMGKCCPVGRQTTQSKFAWRSLEKLEDLFRSSGVWVDMGVYLV